MLQQIQLSEKDKATANSALYNYVGEIINKWSKKIIKLKKEYDATFTEGDRDSIK